VIVPNYIGTLFMIALVMHGMGHSMGLLESWQLAKLRQGADYRGVLGRIGANDVTVKAVGALFVIALMAYLAAAYGMWQGLTFWRPMTVGASLLSLALFGLWWNTIPTFNEISAVGFDFVAVAAVWIGMV